MYYNTAVDLYSISIMMEQLILSSDSTSFLLTFKLCTAPCIIHQKEHDVDSCVPLSTKICIQLRDVASHQLAAVRQRNIWPRKHRDGKRVYMWERNPLTLPPLELAALKGKVCSLCHDAAGHKTATKYRCGWLVACIWSKLCVWKQFAVKIKNSHEASKFA